MSTTFSASVIRHPSSASVRPPNAFAKLMALFARLRNADGPTLETDLALEFLDEGRAEVATCATEARQIETLAEKLRRHWTQFWSDGQLDPREQRILAADQRALTAATHTHTQHLDQLR